MNANSQHKQKGFTLIELVIYVGIFSILMGVLAAMFGQIVDVQLESESASTLDQDSRYILSRLTYDFKNMNINDTMSVPLSPSSTSATLKFSQNLINYTYSVNSSNNLQVVNEGTNEVNTLNGYDTQVSNLSFTRYGTGVNTDTVKVSFTLTSRERRDSGYDSKTYQTTLSRQ